MEKNLTFDSLIVGPHQSQAKEGEEGKGEDILGKKH